MSSKNKYFFQSEVNQLLKLMINSLYSNKEIFLRELISNASDAIDKLKFYILSNNKKNICKNISKYFIRISIDKVNNVLVISDNGIGMFKDEVINNLGTIAKSGTKEFLKKIDKNNNNIIGQFGVGFYSSFMVSDKVIVYTRSINELNKDNSIKWESFGTGSYFIDTISKDSNGTDIFLYIKEDSREFLDEKNIKDIIIKYSNHINIPIEIETYNVKDKKKKWEKINVSEAIWCRDKSTIKDNDYIDFYKNLTNNLGLPLIWSHNKVEGNLNYINILYVPDTSPWDIYNRDEYKNGIKLYVCKVFVMYDLKKIIPFYLRFIQGIIDSNDLSLNISREILQDDIVLKNLRLSITKKILNMLEKLSLSKDKYNLYWKIFGSIFKEGLAEDFSNKYIISKLLRFSSTKSKDLNDFISLEEYLDRMKPGQNNIFYIASDNYLLAKSSPHLEIYKSNDLEVILLYDKIDEWMMTYLVDFKGIKFISISKNDINKTDLVYKDKIQIVNNNSKYTKNLLIRIKNVLGDLVKDVKSTDYLKNFPVVLTTDTTQMSTQMLKLLVSAGKKVPKIKYLFEINTNHILIKYISNIIDEKLFSNYIKFLFYQAYLVENNSLENPVDFVSLINDLLLKNIIK